MSASTVEILRKRMREKFPQAHGVQLDEEKHDWRRNGLPLQVKTFPQGEISEVVPGGPASGISLLVAGLLGEADEVAPHPEMILVDGADGFDPGSYGGATCSKLLWVRCRSAMEMLKAADLVVRDGNVPFVMLDATGLDRRELIGLPKSGWWRLKQVAESNGCRLVVLSPFPMVPCARRRLTLSAKLSLEDFDLERREVLAKVVMREREVGPIRRTGRI